MSFPEVFPTAYSVLRKQTKSKGWEMGLEPGSEFVVVGEGGTVLLKVTEPPSMREFDEIVAEARKDARLAGLRESDIAEAIRAVRSA